MNCFKKTVAVLAVVLLPSVAFAEETYIEKPDYAKYFAVSAATMTVTSIMFAWQFEKHPHSNVLLGAVAISSWLALASLVGYFGSADQAHGHTAPRALQVSFGGKF